MTKMSGGKRVALVTGSNKGIGFAVVRGLCKQFDGDVYLTARRDALGEEAVKALNSEGLHPIFHQLDITDKASIERLKNFIESTYGGLDILVNNAAIAYKEESSQPLSEKADVTVKTNFCGTLDVCKSLFPLLKPHARVVNVSSRATHMAASNCSDELKARFTAPDITVPEVEQLMAEYVSAAKKGDYEEKGWSDFDPDSSYCYSKLGVTLMSFAQQREFDKDPREDIIVNVCCPGYVDTDLNSHKGRRTVDNGADTPIYLALLPQNITSPKGVFVGERNEIPFKAPEFACDLKAADYYER